MLKPTSFLIAIGITVLVVAGLLYMEYNGFLYRLKNKTGSKWQAVTRPPRNITVIFTDITRSDTAKAWVAAPYRNQFAAAVNNSFTNSHDVLAAFIMHGATSDVQPFWTSRVLSEPPFAQHTDSAAVIAASIEKLHCLQTFDSVMVNLDSRVANVTDSALTNFTDIFGAFQQAAIYFRTYATSPADHKRIFLLSDTKENAGVSSNSIKLNHIGSAAAARNMAEKALLQVQQGTDIRNELRNSEVYILTPNYQLYYSEERNLRRIFWEHLLIDKLKCSNVYYY
jgi:hypothetical protein